jgi:superfamily I DNA/RNA helicase
MVQEWVRERRRTFGLPTYRQLTKEQERVRHLPSEGNILVTGGPGTGKSVVALLRARAYSERGHNYRFIMYNRPLETYCKQLLPGVRSERFFPWIGRTYYNLCQQDLPENGRFNPDWIEIAKTCEELVRRGDFSPREDYLIIDEGQDLPKEFYDFLADLGINTFVVADENQQITDTSSRIESIRKRLDVNLSEVIRLRQNKRNTYPIARLAHHFYNNQAIPAPELPEDDDDDDLPLLITHNDLNAIVRRIAHRSAREKKEFIGVITPDNRTREIYLKALEDIKAREGLRFFLTTYYSKRRDCTIRFDMGGIVVINYQSCKGLEFDTVFITDLQRYRISGDEPDAHKKVFYVMISRAKKHLYILYDTSKGSCEMLKELPDDKSVLERWSMR